MAIKTFTEAVKKQYTPIEEHDSDDPAVFELRALTPPQVEQVLAGANYDDANNLKDLSPQGKSLALKYGLTGWSNVDAAFSEANKARLPYEIRQELAREILIMSFLSEDNTKN